MNKKHIRHYLNATHVMNHESEKMIDECIDEVSHLAYFQAVCQLFHLNHDPLKIIELDMFLDSQDLSFYLHSCQECLVIACTLGISLDRRMKYYEHVNMTKAVIFDAVCNAYLEECYEEYQKTLGYSRHTFLMAPGYGDIPLDLNRQLARLLNTDKKIGMSYSQGGLFIPMKSMLGIVGIGVSVTKSCLSCSRKETCQLRKGGQRCYVND